MLANAGQFSYENAKAQVPQFWQAHFAAGKGAVVMGTYGINIDAEMGNETFEYLIADPCDPTREAPAGLCGCRTAGSSLRKTARNLQNDISRKAPGL